MRGKLILVFIIAITHLLTTVCKCQELQKGFKFRRIESKEKLSDANINIITQDRNGFLWVGTEDGLNRYDGYDFKIYRNIPGDSSSLVKNNIQSILEDSHGTMWVSSLNSGFHRYNRKQDNFDRIEEFSKAHCQVTRIIEDSEHRVWIGGIVNSNAFLAQFDYTTNKWETHHLSLINDAIFTIYQETTDVFWLGTRLNGMFRWNKKTNVLESFKHDASNSNSLPGDYIQKIIKGPSGFLWIATRSGLSKFNPATHQFKNYTIATTQSLPGKPGLLANTILDICEDGEYLWIGTENGGLSRMHVNDEAFINFLYDRYDQNSISNNSIWSLYKDMQGRIWIGAYAKGLSVYDKIDINFFEVKLPLETDLINAVLRDSKDRLWICTEEGVVMQDKTKKYHFKHIAGNSASLSTDAATCIFEDKHHQIWIGNWNGGINLFNEQSKNFVHYLPESGSSSLTNPNVFCITQSSKTGELLVCTFGGLFILHDQSKGIFENITNGSHEGDALLNVAYEDSRKNIWVGSYGGLSRFDIISKKYIEFKLASDSSEIDDRVNSIIEDHKGRIWVGTQSGLHELSGTNKSILYTMRDNLPTNVIEGMLVDDRGMLWLGTTNGLVEFDPDTKNVKTYDESNGLHSSDFRAKAFFKDKDGKLYIGGKGLNYFNTDNLSYNTNKPSVYITDLKIFNESVIPGPTNEVLKQSILETKEIYLTHKVSFFSLHFVGINFTASEKNQYAFKLDGFDTNWNYVGDLRFATYTNLSPGTYTFKVKASNNDGLWNNEGTSLVIHVLPPWWKTLAFRLSFIISIILLAIAYYYIRVKSIQKQNTTLENLVRLRTSQLQSTNSQLEKQEEEIKAQNLELLKQREELASQNEELIQGQEEASAQRDLLSEQNKELEEARNIIESKNKETLLHNQNLELEVEKRTQELLTHNNQLEQFAFISAHNLRAPVARILGLGEILKLTHTIEDEKLIREKLIHTTQELDRVVKDLSQILDIRKNNTSVISQVNLHEEIHLVKANLQKEIDDTGTEIQADFNSVEMINTIKAYMDSILMNLVSNAIKYRHPERKPIIKIKSIRNDDAIQIIVTDNGLGIDLEKYGEKLFKLYNRFHLHVEGKGMGLYIVKTQINALGGTLEVDSVVDHGMTFTIVLPIKTNAS